MPIIKETKAGNGIAIAYHTPAKLEVDLKMGSSILVVHSHTNEQAFLDGLPLAWTWSMSFPVSQLSGDGTFLEDLENALVSLESSPFAGGEIVMDKSADLDTYKARKNNEINVAYQKANTGTFMFAGKEIDYDTNSQINMTATNGIIALTQAMPDNWPGGWKAADNSYVPIPDVETWVSFYKAMSDQGTKNFIHAQELKVQLAEAATIEEVKAIHW